MPASSPLIHAAVAAHARAAPDAIALVHHDVRVTYAELDAAAGQYATALAALGAGPGRFVPVRLDRSPRLVATLLGVLKTGAAYAALDPRWPDERLAAVVRQLAPPVLVTDSAYGDVSLVSAALPGDKPVWHPPPGPLAGIAAGAAPFAPVAVGPEAPACVFFTSGTTGEPKGVVSPHRATTRLFARGGLLDFGPGRVMPQAAALPWDAASLELWGMLTTGGTAVLVDDEYLLPDLLRDLVERAGANTLWLTASLFNLFVDEDVECFAGLRQVFTGGERLSPRHAGVFLARHPTALLVNGYGPVESCVFATAHPIVPADCDRPAGVPIGRPVPGTEVLLLDGERMCAPDEAGEICVAGDGLATGYLGDPALTAARFVTFATPDGLVRVYRTGDRGHRDETGTLHFHGRADRQVKIRGHRIEPAEIESVATRLPAVTAAAVVPVAGLTGDYERLALFYTSAPGEPIEGPDVKQALAAVLPAHCVPDLVCPVDRLPLTANGKLDSPSLLRLLDH